MKNSTQRRQAAAAQGSWRVERSPLCFLEVWKGGRRLGAAVYADEEIDRPMAWFAVTLDHKKVSGALPNKLAAITWLLANCPAGCVVNENCAQWERLPAFPPSRLCVSALKNHELETFSRD